MKLPWIVASVLVATFAGSALAATLEDFKNAGVLYTRDEADQLQQSGNLATTPETALVPLIFNAHGQLATPAEFDAGETGKPYYTSLDKFLKISGEPMDQAKLKGMQAGPNRAVYIYDALQK